MLTTSETAEILGVSQASVRVWLNEEGRPRFPNAQKFGRDWQIPESDLESLPRGRKRGRPPKIADEAKPKTADSPEAEPTEGKTETEQPEKSDNKRAGKKAEKKP